MFRPTRLIACAAILVALSLSTAAQVQSLITRNKGKVEVDASGNVQIRPALGKSLVLFDTCPGAPLSTATTATFCFDATTGAIRISVKGGPYANWSNPGTGPGTVTSVGLSNIGGLTTITGSPITTAGILTQTLNSQSANFVFAAPAGGAGAPSFQLLSASHIPNLDVAKITTGVFGVARGGTGLAAYTQGAMLYANSTSTLAQTAAYVGAARRYMMLNGDGTTPNAPTPTQVAFSDLSGTVTVAQGGTGQTALGSANTVLGVNTSGTASEWKAIQAGSNVTITPGVGTLTIATSGTLAASASGLFDTDTIVNRETTRAWRIIGNTPTQTQSLYLYQTADTNAAGTIPTNYARLAFDWNGSQARIYTAGAGTGAVPSLLITAGSPANGVVISTSGQMSATGSGSITATTATTANAMAWNGLTSATADKGLTFGNFTTSFNFGAATGANTLFAINDTAGNTGTGFVAGITAQGTSMNPLFVLNSASNGIQVDSAGVLKINAAGNIRATQFTGSGSTTNAIDLGTAEVSGTLPNANTTATSANTANAIVARGASGEVAAGAVTVNGNLTVTGTCSGCGSGGATSTNGESVLGTTFAIASTTMSDTGLAVSLPSSGTYLINYNVRVFLLASTTGAIDVELFNSTDSALVANSERRVFYSGSTSEPFVVTGGYSAIVTVAAAKTIKLFAARTAGTYTNSDILSDAAGRTTLNFIKLN